VAHAALHLLAQRDIQVIVGHSAVADAEAIRHAGPCAGTHAYPDPHDPTEDLETSLMEWLERERPDVVLPIGWETVMIAAHRRETLMDMGIRTPAPPPKMLLRAAERHALWELAQTAGVSVPVWRQPQSTADFEASSRHFARPPALVPRLISRPEPALMADTWDEVNEACWDLRRRTGDFPLLTEPIPAQAGWLVVTVLCDAPGGVMARVCEAWTGWDERARAPRWRAIVEHGGAVRAALQTLSAMEWTGPATLQFALDPRDGEPKLLQLWPGLGGGIELAAAAGIDLIWPLIEWALRDPPTSPPQHRTDLHTVWRTDGVPWLFTPLGGGVEMDISPPPGEEISLPS
jgi:hypothetical protein